MANYKKRNTPQTPINQIGQDSHPSRDQIGIGNVAEDAAVAAGRNAWAVSLRIMIGNMWPLLVVLLIAVAVLTYLLLRPTIPEAMTGEFNVAIAEFIVVDENGELMSSDEGQKVAQWLYGRLERDFSKLDLQDVRYELWPPAYTGTIRGDTPAEREQAAQALAARIKAHQIIYGVITDAGEDSELTMEFYVNSKGFEEGEEITGQHELGSPLLIALPFEPTDLQDVENPALSARSQALSLLTLGLAYYASDDFDQALNYFTQAEAARGWLQDAGKEVLYLLLGNTHNRLTSVEKSTTYLTTAQKHYETALAINPTYARAKVGLAGALYTEALGDPNDSSFDTVDLDKLDEAEATFNAALTLGNPPESANIPTKVHFGLGQIDFVRAIILGSDWLEQAKAEFEQVVQAYEGGNERVMDFAGHAYARLGRIAWLEEDTDSAAQHYTRATELVTPYFQSDYHTQLGELYASDGQLELAIAEYEKAIQKAKFYGDEENAQKYAQRVNELRTAPQQTPTSTPTETPRVTETALPTLTPVADACGNDSEFMSDVTIPDGTVIESGQTFTKTWRFQNSGTCTWMPSYELIFRAGEQMDAPPTMQVGQEVAPGATIDISVNFSAPLEPGTYYSTWQLRSPNGTVFGTAFYVQIVVP